MPEIVAQITLDTTKCECKSKCACISYDRYKWSNIHKNLTDSLKFWDIHVIKLNWFKICYPITPPALVSKEYSPGRYRYFSLPIDPFVTVECDRENYMSITAKKFTYQWASLFNTNINEGIKNFQIQLRKFEDKHVQFEFKNLKYYPCYEDHKDPILAKKESQEEEKVEI